MPDDPETVAEEELPEKNTGESFKSRMFGVVVLVAVFGLLYLLAKLMPAAGDLANEKLNTLVPEKTSAETTNEAAENAENVAAKTESPQQIDPVSSPPAPAPAKAPLDFEEEIKRQIADAYPDPSAIEIMAIRITDDESELLAMLKQPGDTKWVDVILQRDKFGRYVSEEGAEVEMKIVPPQR